MIEITLVKTLDILDTCISMNSVELKNPMLVASDSGWVLVYPNAGVIITWLSKKLIDHIRTRGEKAYWDDLKSTDSTILKEIGLKADAQESIVSRMEKWYEKYCLLNEGKTFKTTRILDGLAGLSSTYSGKIILEM